MDDDLAQIDTLLREAVLRDAATRIAAGERPWRGTWVAAGALRRLQRRDRLRLGLAGVEVLLLWGGIAGFGLLLMLLAALLA